MDGTQDEVWHGILRSLSRFNLPFRNYGSGSVCSCFRSGAKLALADRLEVQLLGDRWALLDHNRAQDQEEAVAVVTVSERVGDLVGFLGTCFRCWADAI